MWNYIYPATAIAFLLILSYTDIKKRTAPPKLTHGLLILGITLHLTQSIITRNPDPILESSAAALAMFTIAYIIYRSGGWAGGDVKLFTALGAIIPFYGEISQLTYPIPYPILILAASTISIFPFIVAYGTYKIMKEKSKKLKEDIMKSLPKSIYTALTILAAIHLTNIFGIHPAAVLVITPLIYISREPGYPLTAFLVTLAMLNQPQQALVTLAYLMTASIFIVTGIKTYRSMKRNVLREKKKTDELKEGNIPAQDVWIKEGEIQKKEPRIIRVKEEGELKIDSKKARGMTKEEIKWLKKEGIEELEIKKSLPFIPVLALGTAILLILETFI